jgi:5,10-methylenetetrahydromethanopterin reductase
VTLELFTMSVGEAGLAERLCERAEAAGWDGITFVDSQNLVADPFVTLALGAKVTERLQLMTGVTNAATRHPAALATAIATVQEVSEGRAVLGIGRGDTALFHLGRPPQPLDEFFDKTQQVHTYLQRGTIDINGFPSRLRWLDRARQASVPLDVAVSGPKMITFAARTAERVTFALGADPNRLRWALDLASAAARDGGRNEEDISFGAYVTVGCLPDRTSARELVRGSVAAFAHFSAMPGSTGAGLNDTDRALVAEVGRTYDSNLHLVSTAAHARVLTDEFVDRFAVIGDANECAMRLRELVETGLDRIIVNGPSLGADRDDALTHMRLMTDELMPALRLPG